jgi:hypothetical protein
MSNKIYMQSPYMVKLKGRDYLIVAGRILWFRDEHPDGAIITTPIIAGDAIVAVKCEIVIDGTARASGMATVRAGKGTSWDGREVEKAETAAIGRALASAGFGTQFALADLEEADYLADTPINRPTPSSKVEIWNQLRADEALRDAGWTESTMRDHLKYYPRDVVADGYAVVKAWLLDNVDETA